jgi:hypothetical protein
MRVWRHGPRQTRWHISREKRMRHQCRIGVPRGRGRCEWTERGPYEHGRLRIDHIREWVRTRGGGLEGFGQRERRAEGRSRYGGVGCGELDDVGVHSEGRPTFPRNGREQAGPTATTGLGCDARCSPTGGDVETVTALPSMPRSQQLTGARRGSSPKSSGGSAGSCKKLATVVDAVLYKHAIGKSSVTGVSCSASPSNRRLRAAGPDESGTGSPMQALPLLMDWAVSRRLVYSSTPRCGGSISMSCILDRSMTTSPLIAQPPTNVRDSKMDIHCSAKLQSAASGVLASCVHQVSAHSVR